ncbi:arsenite methyltransferase-like [Octopus vulgaris]|uniref:Arsenite methyltransferase-like n=1 Tax=Octopus vulgaris TaxID=6645 RepID=A0AA36B3U5_OCTVU|nr:arsenite methyltransferase-like [Octopus vulgaris]
MAMAALLHYFLLTSLMWTSFEAIHIYVSMVLVFRTYQTSFMMRSSILAWGFPAIAVLTALLVNYTDGYVKTGQVGCVVSIRKKPQEFDGKVSWEAYRIQFEMLSDQNDWDEGQRAVQLPTSLKGPALEVLGQLSEVDTGPYLALVEVLQRKYGTMCQSEMYRARFRTRVRARGELLQQLAQDLESTVHKAYPTATPDLLSLFLKEQFLDALDSANLKVRVKQTRPSTMQDALASALEFESYIKSSTGNGRPGHKRQDCYSLKREKKLNGRAGSASKGECWICGKKGHISYDCPTRTKERVVENKESRKTKRSWC